MPAAFTLRVELQAEDAYASSHLNSASAAASLYQSLAGGWTQCPPKKPATPLIRADRRGRVGEDAAADRVNSYPKSAVRMFTARFGDGLSERASDTTCKPTDQPSFLVGAMREAARLVSVIVE